MAGRCRRDEGPGTRMVVGGKRDLVEMQQELVEDSSELWLLTAVTEEELQHDRPDTRQSQAAHQS